jgi:hypothetical protein
MCCNLLGILRDDNNDPLEEENFEEAIRAVNAEIQPSRIPSDVREILDDPACVNLTSHVRNNYERKKKNKKSTNKSFIN